MMEDFADKFEDLSENLGLLSVVDKETGETWSQESKILNKPACCLNVGVISKWACCKSQANTSSKKWRIPKEYSRLGKPAFDGAGSESKNEEIKVIWGKKSEESPLSDTTGLQTCEDGTRCEVLEASMPLLAKLPSFGRKRQASSLVKVPEKKQDIRPNCLLRRFLEERGELLFVGRLLLVILALLVPGFVLPIIIYVKRMCHFQTHYHNEEYQSEMFSVLYDKDNIPIIACKLCRDQRKSEKMLRLHSYFKAEHEKFRSANPST